MNQHYYGHFLRFPLIIRLLLISCLIMILFGITIHLLEPTNFPTVFDGIWWAFVTSSTVGFGDYTPKTMLGRITGILLILFGVSFLTFYFAHLATVTVAKQNEFLEGKSVFRGIGHLIIVGWNERSRKMIAALTKKNPPKQIIIIDETLDKLPAHHSNVHFIKGRANSDATLAKANLAKAESVIITADPNKDELQADMNTILTLLAVKGLNPDIKCIVEILTTEHVLNARRAGADKLIRTNNLLSSVMLNLMHSTLSEATFNELINFKQNWLNHINISEEYIGKRFSEVSSSLFLKKTILIGVIRGEETFVNPPHEFILQQNDQLLAINDSLLI